MFKKIEEIKKELDNMRFINYFLLAIFMTVIVSGCGQGAPDENVGTVDENEETPDERVGTVDERVVKMETSKGEITIRLFPEYAPLAVENFITHSEAGYFDGLIFHRVIKDFMVQGGDPLGTGTGGESIYGEPFKDEFSPSLSHSRGALSMANAGPNTNGSQFFIVQGQDGATHLDGKHTVFGEVIEGMDVVDAIAETEVGAQDRPIEDIVIERIEIVK